MAFFGLCFWVIELNEEVCHQRKNAILKPDTIVYMDSHTSLITDVIL